MFVLILAVQDSRRMKVVDVFVCLMMFSWSLVCAGAKEEEHASAQNWCCPEEGTRNADLVCCALCCALTRVCIAKGACQAQVCSQKVCEVEGRRKASDAKVSASLFQLRPGRVNQRSLACDGHNYQSGGISAERRIRSS